MILRATRPLIMLGRGRLAPALLRPGCRRFVRRTQIPFFNTQMGKGTVAGGTNLYMGTAALSERDYVHEAIDRADLIIAIGHDTVEKPPFIMGPGGPQVIHVGYTPANVEQVYFPHAEVVGDVGPSLELLADRLEGKLHHAGALLSLREEHPGPYHRRATEDRFPPTPQRIVHDVRQVMPEDGIVALDNGMYKIWFARNYRTHVANTLLLDNALATMGAGLPSAMMAAMLYPDRRVLAVCGDGGFMMNSQEMETAVRLRLNLVVLILEDGAYGMIRWKQAVDNFADCGLTFGNPDFVKYAETYGAKGTRVTSDGRAGPDAGGGVQGRRRASRDRADRLLGEHARAGGRIAGAHGRGAAGSRTGGGADMKIRAAVLDRMGAEPPYAQSKPLRIEELELDPPGPGEVLVKIAAAGLCHSDLSVINGDRPRPMPMALGHEAAGVVETVGEDVTDLEVGRPRRHGVRAELRPLRALRGGPPGAVRTGCGGERRRHAAVRRAPAALRRRRGEPSSRRLGVCRICGGVAPLGGEDRPRPAARRGGAVRLRRADRRRRRGQHGQAAAGSVGGGDRPGRRRLVVGARRGRVRRAAHGGGRSVRRQAGPGAPARRHATRSTRATRMRPSRSAS